MDIDFLVQFCPITKILGMKSFSFSLNWDVNICGLKKLQLKIWIRKVWIFFFTFYFIYFLFFTWIVEDLVQAHSWLFLLTKIFDLNPWYYLRYKSSSFCCSETCGHMGFRTEVFIKCSPYDGFTKCRCDSIVVFGFPF